MRKKTKLKKMAAREGTLKQVAALPYRVGEHGIEFLIITSRRTKRLIVPKGWPIAGKSDASAAAIEAIEEAGVKGRIETDPMGSFEYLKAIGSKEVRVNASVFPLRVRKMKSSWKECKQRKRMWMPAEEAALRLDDGGLRLLVQKYAENLRASQA